MQKPRKNIKRLVLVLVILSLIICGGITIFQMNRINKQMYNELTFAKEKLKGIEQKNIEIAEENLRLQIEYDEVKEKIKDLNKKIKEEDRVSERENKKPTLTVDQFNKIFIEIDGEKYNVIKSSEENDYEINGLFISYLIDKGKNNY